MKNIVMEEFFDFEIHFKEFLKRIKNFNFENITFLVFNDNFKEISYSYSSDDKKEITFKKYSNINKDGKLIEDNYYVSINEYTGELCECSKKIYLINILNPFVLNKRNILGSIVVCVDNEKITYEDIEVINIHYAQQLLYHVYVLINNYDRLYNNIDIFSELLVDKDKYMPYHMTNVADLCIKLSINLFLSEKEQMLLYFSALLHDIGKLFVPEEIINKKEPLIEEEFDRLKKHSQKGSEIVSSVFKGLTLLSEIPLIIKHHHERYDGKGYPEGLISTKIPYLSRILTVADCVDAMMSTRAYKNKMSLEKVISELEKNSGKQFDPFIAKEMINILNNSKTDIVKDISSEYVFIPKASLSFKYANDINIVSLVGNLVINNKVGRFIAHNLDKRFFALNAIKETTVSYIKNEDIIEYRARLKYINENEFFLYNFIHMPTDKTFSIIWEGKTDLRISRIEKSFKLNIVKLGGDSIVLVSDLEESKLIISNIHNELTISLKESIDELEIDFLVKIKIIKYYVMEQKCYFICRYVDIKSSEKDKIIRLLFKKQVLRKKISNSNFNK